MKLRILCLEPGHHYTSTDGPFWSWPVREMGADVAYFENDPESVDKSCAGFDVVVYLTTDFAAKHPSTEALLRAKTQCGRFVMASTDVYASDYEGANPLLKEYSAKNVFDSIVALDGSVFWHDLPTDWSAFGLFDPAPWEGRGVERIHRLGFSGGPGRRRNEIGGILGRLPGVSWITCGPHPRFVPYQNYIDWALSCRAILNSGGGQCKGRVNEAAMAGCLLFDEVDSLTPLYMKSSHVTEAVTGMPDGDYLEFSEVDDVIRVLNRPDYAEFASEMGTRFRKRLLERYGPRRFWEKVVGTTMMERH